MIIAIIPARGGSKRIPRKNICIFAGKPIIAYSIEAARQSGLFDRIVVSTDDAEIARVASEWGAEIPFLRPAALADDFSGTNAVVKHAIRWFNDRGDSIDYACCIYPTAPFLQACYLREGYDKLVASGKSFVFSVTTFRFSIQRAIRINVEGAIEALYPEQIFTRSQDLETAYHDAGQFYWGRADAFLDDVVTYSPASLPVVLPGYLVQDIDTLDDWRRAELMYASLNPGARADN